MKTLASALAGLGLLAASSGMALAQTPAATPPAAPAPAAAAPAQHRVVHQRAAYHDTAGDADTAALNLLEAHGYTNIKQFSGSGSQFQAVVDRDGKPVTVTVDPATGAVRQS